MSLHPMSSSPEPAPAEARRALVPVLIFLGMVVAVVSSLGAPLVPTIAADTHVSLTTAQWSLTISLLVGAVATPLMGRLGDGPHRREVVLIAMSVVTVGCLLAALPLSFGALVVGRALMGIGLGLTPLAMATARDALRGERSRSAVALLSITTVAGIGLGYPLTGVIADVVTFRAAFAFGGVVTLVGLVAAYFVFPSTRGPVAPRLDVLGAVLLGAGVAGILVALGETEQWSTARLATVAVLSLALLGGWVVHELRVDNPLVDLRLVRNRTVLTADLLSLFGGMGMYIVMSLIIRFVQTPTSAGYGFGSSVVVAGLTLVPLSVMSVAASRVAPLLARRFGQHAVLPIGCLIFVLAEAGFLLFRGSLWHIFVIMGLTGLAIGCTFAALPGLIVSAVPPSETGSAMSFNQVLRYIGASMGSALSATVLEAHTPVGAALPTDSGYTTGAIAGMTVLAVAGVLALVLPGRPNQPAISDADEELLEEESLARSFPLHEQEHVAAALGTRR